MLDFEARRLQHQHRLLYHLRTRGESQWDAQQAGQQPSSGAEAQQHYEAYLADPEGYQRWATEQQARWEQEQWDAQQAGQQPSSAPEEGNG